MKKKAPKVADIYNHQKIEPKWQKIWEKTKPNSAKDFDKKPKFYALIEFPYPSGDGLHVGHIRSNTAMDIIARKRRREGFNVLYPIGWDAFGLPTENYAIKTGIQPAIVTKKNSATFKRQLKALGFSFDWSREVNTTDPKYYRWTQWIFLQLLKAGLAYKKKMTINWCPKDLIGLANEEVVDGCCERCGTPVEKRDKEQWMLAITKYAERLLTDLDATKPFKRPKVIDKVNPHQPGKPLVTRYVAHAIVYDPKNKKYLIIRNKKFSWDTVIIGGIEPGETAEETARREVREETGYADLHFKRILGGATEAHYYTKHKGENRIAIAQAAYFELKSETKVAIAAGEDKDNEILWIEAADFVPGKMVNSELPIWLERLKMTDAQLKATEPEPLLDWRESIKELQRNWIGKSEGAEISFALKFKRHPEDNERRGPDGKPAALPVFTTRPDTIFGVTYIVLSPEHLWVKLATDDLHDVLDNKDEVKKYVVEAKAKPEIERTDQGRVKTGVELKGVKAVNPANGDEIPMYVADYVLADYGTGVVMAVPAHDVRDWEFAKKYNLPIKDVVKPANNADKKESAAYIGEGTLVNSGKFDGRNSITVMKEITENVGGKLVTKYKLRDWVFSRQRYWGDPIPVIHCPNCGIVPVPEKDLPVKLPKVKNYKPTETGESPLAAIDKWVNVKCPKCKGKAKRETDTMPNWAGSSWYYLRYTDPRNGKAFADAKKLKYWTPVDWYNGGMEHTTLHLLYSRFWHKFLYDQGLVPTIEPYTKRTSHGFILAENGEKMSKSRGNVVNPDDVVKNVGADTLRVYEMFMGPFDQRIAWDTNNIAGSRRFIEKVWRLREKIAARPHLPDVLEKSLHKTVKKVSEDIEAMRFNTAISALMILVNEMEKLDSIGKHDYEILVQLIAPFAPHMAEELWTMVGNKGSVHASPWPKFDSMMTTDDEVKIIVQINGKVRGSFMAHKDTGQNELENSAKAMPEIGKWLEGKQVNKVIVVPGRLVNIVVS